LIYCADENILGSEFYLMERRSGLIIRGKSPENLESSKELQRKVCESFIENLANLHALDYKKIGLENLGKPEGYAQRQVEGWTNRYFKAKTDEHAELENVIEWLNANIPKTSGAALVHNDYKFDNVMLNPENLTEIVAVLDWEMTTIGEPLMDLGTTLGYWMSKEAGGELLSMPFNPRVLMENISRRELVEFYAEKSGRDVSEMLFYYIFGTFKIAVIAQQIYFRFVNNFTNDKRFANFNSFVASLGNIALSSIEKGKF
ncbi:MAG: phosphotransferase family protein, partial [Pyrinomonadaceae bacterium]